VESIERVLGQDAVVAHALDLEQFAVDLIAQLRRCRRLDALRDLDVPRPCSAIDIE
jgi:hypothetical protein